MVSHRAYPAAYWSERVGKNVEKFGKVRHCPVLPRDALPMSDPWSTPPGGDPPPPPEGGAIPPPPPPPPPPSPPPTPPPPPPGVTPPPPSWSAPPPPPPTTPSYTAPPPPGYGATPGAGPTGYGPTPAYIGPANASGQKTNVLAIVSLIAGVLGLCCGISAIGAIVCGILAKNQIKQSNGLEKGDGLALAGIITGGVGIFLGLVWLLFSIAA